MSELISLFIVDDHDLFRDGVKSSVGEHFDVVEEADDADPAIESDSRAPARRRVCSMSTFPVGEDSESPVR